ncbi:MAG: class I SAM-dependent methyltransferase [Pseudomonadota bacterium]
MRPDVFERIAGYYDGLVARYGHDHRACDYGRPGSQRTKFRVLAEVMPLIGKTVLDVGCGMADFAEFLAARHPGVDYHGIDISERMIAEARHLDPTRKVRQSNVRDGIDGIYDVVFANGIFYLLGEDAPRLMRMIICIMFDAAREAVAFNSLSALAPDREAGEFYPDPVEVFAVCRQITPWVVLRHDYHPRDFTIYMYRERR